MAERPLTCVLCPNALPDISEVRDNEVAVSVFQSKQLATLKCLNLDSVCISQASKALEKDSSLRVQGFYCSQCSKNNASIFKLLSDLDELQNKLQNFRDLVTNKFKESYSTLNVANENSSRCRGAARHLSEVKSKIAKKVLREEPKSCSGSFNDLDTYAEDPFIGDINYYDDDDFEADTAGQSFQHSQVKQPFHSEQDRALLAKFGLRSCFVQLQPLPPELENALGVANGPYYCLFEDCQPRTEFTVQQRNEHMNLCHGLKEQDIVALDMTVNVVPKASRIKSICTTPTKKLKTAPADPSEPHQDQDAEDTLTHSTCIFDDCHFTGNLESTQDFLQHIHAFHGIEMTEQDLTSLTTRAPGSKTRKSYSCSMCAAKFKTQTALFKHFREYHATSAQDVPGISRRGKSIAFLCPVVSCLFKEKFNTTAEKDHHMDSCHPNLKELQLCIACKRYLDDPEALKNHLLAIHRCESLRVCEICGKQYTSADGLERHRASHHDSLKFKCPHCDARFMYTSSVTYHINRVHVQKPEFHCETCGRMFYTAFKLKEHIKCVHTDCRDVICQYCGMGFPIQSYLRRHLIKTHGAPKGRNSREHQMHRREEWKNVFVKSDKPKRRSRKMLVDFKEGEASHSLNSSSAVPETGTSYGESHGNPTPSSSAGHFDHRAFQSGNQAEFQGPGGPVFIYDTHNSTM